MHNVKLKEALLYESPACDFLRKLFINSAFAMHLLTAAVKADKIEKKAPYITDDVLDIVVGTQKEDMITLDDYVINFINLFQYFEKLTEEHSLFATIILADPTILFIEEEDEGNKQVEKTLENVTNLIARDSMMRLNAAVM